MNNFFYFMKVAISGASGKTGFRIVEEALKKGVFGAPTFRINKKIFWGQDRISYAIDEIK